MKKFVSAANLDINEVKNILLNKISEEQANINNIQTNTDLNVKIKRKRNKFNVVSLFSGAGGLDLGVELSGIDAVKGTIFTDKIKKNYNDYNKYRSEGIFNFIYSNDIFKEANETYKANFSNEILQDSSDIRKIKKFPNCQVIVGGFPCPGFSAAGPRLIDDSRNFLYIHFIRALVETKPEFFVAENVKGILTLANGEVFKQIKQDFASAGYDISAHLVNSKFYGVPQIRERVIIVGTSIDKIKNNYDWKYELPRQTHGNSPDLHPLITLRNAIGDLSDNPGNFYKGSYSSMYLSRNRKKSWNDQSYTIQASGRQAPLHPGGYPMKKISKDKWELVGYNRRLSVNEIARIQTFPDWFKFSDGRKNNLTENGRLNLQYKQIGNAVPVELARRIFSPISEFLNNHKELSQK